MSSVALSSVALSSVTALLAVVSTLVPTLVVAVAMALTGRDGRDLEGKERGTVT